MALPLIYDQAVFWVETKGKSLEEIDAIFGESHSTVRNLEDVRTGREALDVAAVEKQLDVELKKLN